MKRAVTVQIAGQRYTLRADDDDENVRKLAAFVDGRMKEIQKQTRTADTQSAAILAALQIAEELFRQRREQAELRKLIREKGRAILQVLEREARV